MTLQVVVAVPDRQGYRSQVAMAAVVSKHS
jgi:hypothetical protein